MEINDTNKYNTKDIAKWIREQFKAKFKDLKISVRTKYYSMGSSIHIHLMKSNLIKFIRDATELNENNISSNIISGRGIEQIRRVQGNKHHQLNGYTLREPFESKSWCNGVFLTEKGHNILMEIEKIAHQYNYDNSDSRIDYFDVNYYVNLALGKWDKDFEDGLN